MGLLCPPREYGDTLADSAHFSVKGVATEVPKLKVVCMCACSDGNLLHDYRLLEKRIVKRYQTC